MQQVVVRKEAAERLGLREFFDNSFSFVHYFLPTSPLFIVVYVVYLIMAINLAYLARRTEKGRFRRIIIGSFTDLKNLSWLNGLSMMVSNVIWPFEQYGLAGCLVALVYWPIVLPLTGLVHAFYFLPTVYLTVRMFFYSKMAFLRYARTCFSITHSNYFPTNIIYSNVSSRRGFSAYGTSNLSFFSDSGSIVSRTWPQCWV